MEADKSPILHIITRLEAGGSARNVLDSAAFQAKRRRVVLAAGPCRGKECLRPDPASGCSFVEVPTLERELSPLNDLRAFLALKKLISQTEPAIVHTHTAKAGILGRWAARLARHPSGRRPLIIHTPHGHVLYGYFGRLRSLFFLLAERLTAAITDHFIALTEGELRESSAAGIGPAASWSVVHSGVPLDEAAAGDPRGELGLGRDEFVVATAARLEPVKGVEFFIRSAPEVLKKAGEKKIRFLVIGDGSLRPRLEAEARELGLGNAVLFTGFRNGILKYLPAADLFVQPSLNEAMGRTAIEAQYCGLPVIASRVCGLPDVVEDGVTGILVPPGDAPALASAIIGLAADDGLRRRMGAAARARVTGKDRTGFQRFSVESMNVRLEELYQALLAARAGG